MLLYNILNKGIYMNNCGISLDVFFFFDYYANTFRNFIFNICDTWNPWYSSSILVPKYVSSSIYQNLRR